MYQTHCRTKSPWSLQLITGRFCLRAMVESESDLASSLSRNCLDLLPVWSRLVRSGKLTFFEIGVFDIIMESTANRISSYLFLFYVNHKSLVGSGPSEDELVIP